MKYARFFAALGVCVAAVTALASSPCDRIFPIMNDREAAALRTPMTLEEFREHIKPRPKTSNLRVYNEFVETIFLILNRRTEYRQIVNFLMQTNRSKESFRLALVEIYLAYARSVGDGLGRFRNSSPDANENQFDWLQTRVLERARDVAWRFGYQSTEFVSRTLTAAEIKSFVAVWPTDGRNFRYTLSPGEPGQGAIIEISRGDDLVYKFETSHFTGVSTVFARVFPK